MITSDIKSSPVITNISSTPNRFRIKASARAFKILSGFYSEPILAIPRELGANAWDSHVKKGNTDRMFEVHAPNPLEPWFSIRDFGTGLSAGDIDTIYTTYFESTKTSENDSDGCMGLGSKTPFNYTENFNVTSWYDGKKHVYNCYIDESGSPNIVHIATEDSSDHTGLEVKFGVKLSDISMWVDKIRRAYEPFRFRPVIKGASIVYPERTYLYKGTGWAYRGAETGYYNRECNAFMGNYCYPISVNALRNKLQSMQSDIYSRLTTAFNQGGFDFFFNIGDLEVAPNKEQLQYEDNNSTTNAILAATKVAVKELEEMVRKTMEVPATRWEAMALYNKHNNYSSPYRQIRDIIGEIPIYFNNNKIASDGENVATVHRDTGLLTTNNQLEPYQLYVIDNSGGRCKRSSTYFARADRETIFLYTNCDHIKIARVRYYLANKYGSLQWPICNIIVDASKKNKTFLAHKKYFGWKDSDVVEIECLPKPPPRPRVRKTATTNEIWYADLDGFISPGGTRGTSTAQIYWEKKPETIDSTKTYYYVDFLYNDAVWGDIKIKLYMDYIATEFVGNKLNNGERVIYGVNKTNRHLLRVGNWVNVTDEVKKVMLKNKAKYEQTFYMKTYNRTFLMELSELYSEVNRHREFINGLKNLTTKSLFQEFLKEYKRAQEGDSQLRYHDEDFYKLLHIAPKKHAEPPMDTIALKKVVDEKYMGIFYILETYGDRVATRLSAIINFIDKNS